MAVIVMIRLVVPQFSSLVTAGEKVSPQRERALQGEVCVRPLLL